MDTRRRSMGLLWLVCGIVVLGSTPGLVWASDGSKIVEESGVAGGLVVHLGCGDGAVTGELRCGEQYLVHGLDTDAGKVAAARELLVGQGEYGAVCVDQWDGRHLPYADNLVNLIVVDDAAQVSDEEMLRVLAPRGVALVRGGGQLKKIVKEWPAGMDEWTHYLHGSDGNPVADDTIVGPPARLQWVGSPRWSRHHDHMASMTSMVSAGGRLFYIMDEGPTASIQLPERWRLVGRDAFNGVVLWKRDISQWNTRQYPLKSGPAHLLRRLVAVGDEVYVTLGIDAAVSALDGASGETVRSYGGSEHTREIVVCDGAVLCVADTSRSLLPDFRREGESYVWANTNRANPGWGWKGAVRKVLAYEGGTGRLMWESESPVAPCSLAAAGGRVVFHDGAKLVCLDGKNGDVVWEGAASPTALPVQTNTGPRVLIHEDVVLFAGNNGKMSGWSVKDGEKLWEQVHRPSGHQSLKDLFVVGGLAWTGAIAGSGDNGTFYGYDPVSGKVEREFPADVQVHWFHHRCYPAKAAGKYLLTARNGTEFIDLTSEHWKPHHWVRGGCIYGVMPCNGMTYAPMSSCGCQLEAKLTGLNALSAGPVVKVSSAALSGEARLQRGPAYGGKDGAAAGSGDWPTYRHDGGRSGTSTADVSGDLKQVWEVKLGGRLTAPTIAAGKVFVASTDTHTLYGLDAATGRRLWSYTTGGRIDSPPTYHKGLALFGSADGYVYAVRASDGVLAWRFRGAPIDRRVMAWEQLESAWPVHGSVLVHDDVLYCTAGRNMYVDGGVRFIRLNPVTGAMLGETVMGDTDPATGEDMHLAYLKKTQGNNMPVAHTDVLSCDGRHIWMRSQKITLDGKRLEIALENVKQQENEDFHLFCQNGFLDDSYFFRSYWTYGRRVTGGYGAWPTAGRLVPSGRILCFEDKAVYGFGRKMEYMVNSSVLEYQFFAADKVVTAAAIDRLGQAERAMNERSKHKGASASDWKLRSFFPVSDLSAATYQWRLDQPAIIARAMTVAGGTIFAAGPEDLIDERNAFYNPDDPQVQATLKRQAAAIEGKLGGQLWAMSTGGGKVGVRYALDTIPVFDGIAAAGGSLYMSTVDGRVMRLGESGGKALKKVVNSPVRVVWEKKEDPSYLLAPEVRKEGDFAKVMRCKVTESELGYRLASTGKKQVSLAIKKLAEPATGLVTLSTRMKAVANADGLLRNGYLVFGDGMQDASLIKCGARLRTKEAYVIQGALLAGQKNGSAIEVRDDEVVDVVVKVDLKAQRIVCTVKGVTIEAKIMRPLKSITYVGYAADSAMIDFAPVKVQSR